MTVQVYVWMQTTNRRDASRTTESIERSDIGKDFQIVVDPYERSFPQGYEALQRWWFLAWYSQIQKAEAQGCSHILRLEDDIVVNEHILHNVTHWAALASPKFGVGTLFVPNHWESRPELMRIDPVTQEVFRSVRDVEGAQGQVIPIAKAREILQGVPAAMAQRERETGEPHPQPSFDWSVSRSAANLGLYTFVHLPALVDLHEGSLQSKIDQEQHTHGTSADPSTHYWGSDSFNPHWRARENV